MSVEIYRQAVKSAQAAVADLGLSPELEVAAFAAVLRVELGAPGDASRPLEKRQPADASVGPTHGLDALAKRVHVSVDALNDLFSIRDGSVEIHVPSSRISDMKKTALLELGLLLGAVRQGTGIDDEWTSVGLLRDVLEDYSRSDAGNFAQNLRAAQSQMNVRGTGRAAEFRLTRPGWEAASSLIKRLAE